MHEGEIVNMLPPRTQPHTGWEGLFLPRFCLGPASVQASLPGSFDFKLGSLPPGSGRGSRRLT